MSDDESDPRACDLRRRAMLQTAAGMAIAQLALDAPAAPLPPAAPAKAGEFEFLTGNWRIVNRRLKSPGVWDTFPGEATCWGILRGTGSIEELKIPARDFFGLGIRLLDPAARVWNDYWVNARENLIGAPGMNGTFIDGAGVFTAEDKEGDQPIRIRATWDRITPTSCRWQQAVSRDGGRTFETNWAMDWTRVSSSP